MAIARSINLVLGLALLSCMADGALRHHIGLSYRRDLIDTNVSTVTVFDVTKHGAKADDKTDNAQAFIQTWRLACDSGAPTAKLVIPGGTFLTSPVVFQGPCNTTNPIIFEVQGHVKATTDLSEYSSPEWILFEIINGLTLNGGGVFDGQGSAVWKFNDCHGNKDCQPLPSSIKLNKVNNSAVYEISSVNSKYFHMHVTNCNNLWIHNINLTAPADSPNTDGIHISHSSGVNVTSSVIGTGDDCVSVGQGVTNLFISDIFCGPGHGISVGSLGKYENEEDVSGVLVTNCTLSNTTNGARIKTYTASMPSQASNIIFQDIIMNGVKNPIIIDQNYGSRKGKPSQVKISDVHFKNIKGTSISNFAVSLMCSSLAPCEGVELVNIDLAFTGSTGSKGNGALLSSCTNAKVTTVGIQNPVACSIKSLINKLFN